MAYGKYRHSTIYGEKGSIWNIEIWKDDYGASSNEIDLSGEGFEITWNGQGGTRNRVFLGSECKLNCIIKNNGDESFAYDTINAGYKEYFIRIYRGAVQDSNLWWYGWVQPAFDKLENAPYPYVFQLTATDSYGFWSKKKESTFANDTERNAPHKIRDILFTLINDMNLNISSGSDLAPIPQNYNWCRTSLDWWRDGDTYNSDDPAVLYYAAKGFVTDSNDDEEEISPTALKYKPSDVFNGVLKTFNTLGYLAEGKYNFIQPNNFADNTTGQITAYEYNSDTASNPSNPITLDTLLTIDQSNHVILGGSTINYEPSFESVAVNFKGGFMNFDISPGQFLNNEFYAGSLQSGLTGLLTLSFNAQYYESVFGNDFNTSGVGYDVERSSYTTTGTLKIRITDGSNNKYLVQTAGSNILTWENSESPIMVYRGFGISDNLPVNNTSFMAIGPISNVYGQTGGPCDLDISVTNNYQFYTDILFNANVEQPPISGDVYIEFDCGNYYFQRHLSSGAVTTLTGSQPTPGSQGIECVEITLEPTQYNQENDVSDGLTYTASQTNNDAIEQFDLGDVQLGVSILNNINSIQYNSGTSGSPFYTAASTFRRGNSGTYKNPSVLLVTEFLEFQVEPLEILQADIQSADISPLKLIKYSIDNDTNHKYYSFLGGTFKGQSEILSGEWFKVNSINTNIVDEENYSGSMFRPSTPPIQKELFQKNLIAREALNNGSYGTLNADLATGTTDNKITLSSNSKGIIYSGQKLLLTYADGSNPLVLTASADATTSSTQINLSSFTLKTKYPAGSVLSPLIYDLTNVITGTPNLYRGVTTTAIYIMPSQFNITSRSDFSTYTRDNLGSVQPTAYFNRSKIYASSFIPANYRVTAIDIDSSQNRNIRILTGRWGNDTTTLQGTGTANTTLTLSTAWSSYEGDYVILEYEPGASTDEIYGAKITIEAL